MLNLGEQHQHLLLFFFGAGTDPIVQCVDRAYRDFNRTMHGLKDQPGAVVAGRRYLYARLRDLQTAQDVDGQSGFDAWHERSCAELINAVKVGGYSPMHIGQAQKWLNMSMKYSFLFSPQQLPGFVRAFPWCHIPIDNVILRCTAFKDAPKLTTAWSRIADYAAYMSFQSWARKAFPGQLPLAVEFKSWAEAQIAA